MDRFVTFKAKRKSQNRIKKKLAMPIEENTCFKLLNENGKKKEWHFQPSYTVHVQATSHKAEKYLSTKKKFQ